MRKTAYLRIPIMVALAIGTLTARAADIVAVGNPAAVPLTKEQLSDIYLGRSQAMTPLDQAESSPIRIEYYKKLVGKDPAQVKALWTRLTFTGKGQSPKELPDSAAIKKAVAGDPKAVGYIEKSAVDTSVKVLCVVE